MKYVFSSPVRVGGHVYMPVGEMVVDKLTVTEVASKGIFVSEFDPPEDDMGMYLPYEDEGDTWFLTEEGAIAAYEEGNQGP